MKKSPLAQVKDRFGSKEKLIAEVRSLAKGDLWVDHVNEDGGLDLVSNRKLLHLYDVLSEVKKEHGSRKGLVDAILEKEKRVKDEGYRARLEAFPTTRLFDEYKAAKKRAAKASAKAS